MSVVSPSPAKEGKRKTQSRAATKKSPTLTKNTRQHSTEGGTTQRTTGIRNEIVNKFLSPRAVSNKSAYGTKASYVEPDAKRTSLHIKLPSSGAGFGTGVKEAKEKRNLSVAVATPKAKKPKVEQLKGKLKNLASDQKAGSLTFYTKINSKEANSTKTIDTETYSRTYRNLADTFSINKNDSSSNKGKLGKSTIKEKLDALKERLKKAFDDKSACINALKEKLKTFTTTDNII